MNILIKLTCLVGLVIAPILGGHGNEEHSMHDEKVETEVVLEVNTCLLYTSPSPRDS